MLQQRAVSKYHSGGLWTNTCCSHPRDGETVAQASLRRLQEEMGFQTELIFGFSFIYKAALEHGLTEHELDHVFIGYFEETPNINPNEVSSWRWTTLQALSEDMAINPERYTAWFKIIMNDHGQEIFKLSQSVLKNRHESL